MNESGALLECYWWGTRKFLQKNLSQCHFVYQKSNIHWPGIEGGLPWFEACNLSHGMVTSYYRMMMTTTTTMTTTTAAATTTTTTGTLSYWHEINLERSDNYCTNFIPVFINVNKKEVPA